MKATRSEELRRRNRRVFAASMAAAAAIHVGVFVAFPGVRPDPTWSRVVEPSDPGEPADLATSWELVDVFFGPPAVVEDDGTLWQEPPERVLEARKVEVANVRFSASCRERPTSDLVPAEARVRLVLSAGGRVVERSVAVSSGDPCRDELLASIARSVWYQWIPNERFPAPVELIQPMRVVPALD